MKFTLKTPQETLEDLANRLKKLRLIKKWKRSTLAKRSGVTEASLKRFEQTGKVSLENFVKLVFTLGRIDELDTLLRPPKARSIADLEKNNNPISKRGTI